MSETEGDPPVFSWRWREAHAREGDRLLSVAGGSMESINWDKIMTLAFLAQAHYAAANVRAKPEGESPRDQVRRRVEGNVIEAAVAWREKWQKHAHPFQLDQAVQDLIDTVDFYLSTRK